MCTYPNAFCPVFVLAFYLMTPVHTSRTPHRIPLTPFFQSNKQPVLLARSLSPPQVGVALKSIVYVNAAVHELEATAGCEHAKEHLRRLEWAPGGALDRAAATLGSAQFGQHYNLAGGLGAQGGGQGGSSHGRRLAGSFTLDEYDELLQKLYWLLQVYESESVYRYKYIAQAV